ncbi:trigger factor [Rhodobacterales bacterium HKCCE3408]|nr:trigger factor [Rhodobacterales bacterium HKCCE3408]
MITLADFAGRWRLRREIEDRRLGLDGRFEGLAEWEPEGAGLRQTETGVLHFGSAAPMRATRVYLWRWQAHRLVVLFEDGRPFHDFSPGEPEALHDCAPDTYRVRYDFTGWPAWESRWHVTGPRKDAVILSRFVRAE